MAKLYLTVDGDPVKLAPLDPKITNAILADIDAGNVVFELQPQYWSGSATNLPANTQAVYVSGSDPAISIDDHTDLAAAGEMAIFRKQNGQQKSYRYMLVVSGSGSSAQMFYGEEFKRFPEHYYSGAHPTGSIWAKTHPNWPKP